MPLQNPSTHKPNTSQWPPQLAKTFTNTEIGTQIDLRAQVGFPPYAPQRLILCNSAATVASAVLTDAGGNTVTIAVAPVTTVPVDLTILTIEASTTDVATFSIVACWWVDGSHPLNTA